jgi:hypothetical protein
MTVVKNITTFKINHNRRHFFHTNTLKVTMLHSTKFILKTIYSIIRKKLQEGALLIDVRSQNGGNAKDLSIFLEQIENNLHQQN